MLMIAYVRGTEGTAGCLEGNVGKAIRALLGLHGISGHFFRTLEDVHAPDDEKEDQGNDEEAEGGIDEEAEIERDGAVRLSFRQSLVGTARGTGFHGDKPVAEIDPAGEEAQDGGQDIAHEGFDDGREGSPDNDADPHVDSVSLDRKLLELVEYFHVWILSTAQFPCQGDNLRCPENKKPGQMAGLEKSFKLATRSSCLLYPFANNKQDSQTRQRKNSDCRRLRNNIDGNFCSANPEALP